MATRGTGYLLLKGNVLSSTEFNGDMYPSGHGDDFFNGIKGVKNKKQFGDFLKAFNDERFRYQEELVYKDKNTDFYDVMANDELIIDFNNEYFERFFSDWIFFKNLTGSPVKFITRGDDGKYDDTIEEITVLNGGSFRFNFGRVEGEED